METETRKVKSSDEPCASRTVRNGLIGDSRPMCELNEFIESAARTSSTVLIQGESGTGKELVARGIHRLSGRCGGPFMAVNCAALSEGLIESELFGYEKGAFTGAVTRRKGKFELANAGTLFLDEVGELGHSVQAKLLRTLQEREVDRVGGTSPIPVDIRLIAATNRDLEAAVAARLFREDLYYRLHVLFVRTPPLRERREDIPALARHFILKYAREFGVPVRAVSSDADLVLQKYYWRGNVRQLQNVIERAMVLGSSDVISAIDLPQYLYAPSPEHVLGDPHTLEYAVLRTKREFVEKVFELTGRDRAAAASFLGIHPRSMRRFLQKLNLLHLIGGSEVQRDVEGTRTL